MSDTSSEKLDLVNRTKKVIGQLESVLRAKMVPARMSSSVSPPPAAPSTAS